MTTASLVTAAHGQISPETFTRAEVAKMSPQELAKRVLGAAGSLGTAKEIKTYISPVMPTPPWLEQVAVDLPPTYLASFGLCMSNRALVNFTPVDPKASSHMFDSTYDPPTKIVNVDTVNRFAVTPNCKNVPDDAYFDAGSQSAAIQAVDAFKLFCAEAERPDSSAIVCSDFVGVDFCKPGVAKDVTRFERVLSIQEDRHKNASITRTIVLSVSNRYGESKTELWLTVEFGKDMRLTRAELRRLWADPIP